MRAADDRGVLLRTEFFVEQYPDVTTVVLESAGGAEARDYREVLELLLRRLAGAGALLTGGIVDSRVTRALPDAERRLVLRHGRSYPVNLRTADIAELRKAIGAAQEHVGQRPGATAGNRTKRIRLMIASGASPLPDDLEQYLSTGERRSSPSVSPADGGVGERDDFRGPVAPLRPVGPTRIRAVEIPADPRAVVLESLEDLTTPVELFTGALPDPVKTLEAAFVAAGVSLIAAVFQNTFFLHPSVVRRRTPYFPEFVRYSREHYGTGRKGELGSWRGGSVRLDDNSRAQLAWQKYAGRGLSRGVGYAIRHIWGHPWDPNAFTAGWNLAYMPNWAGMLTEAQHPHPLVQRAIRQASWDLFFARNPVCEKPDFVGDPGVSLAELLGEQPLLVLDPRPMPGVSSERGANSHGRAGSHAEVRALRALSNQSWSNIEKAIAALQGRPTAAFGTPNVEASAKSVVRRMCRDLILSLDDLEHIVREITGR